MQAKDTDDVNHLLLHGRPRDLIAQPKFGEQGFTCFGALRPGNYGGYRLEFAGTNGRNECMLLPDILVDLDSRSHPTGQVVLS
jgi:hypothetical protein